MVTAEEMLLSCAAPKDARHIKHRETSPEPKEIPHYVRDDLHLCIKATWIEEVNT